MLGCPFWRIMLVGMVGRCGIWDRFGLVQSDYDWRLDYSFILDQRLFNILCA